MKKKLFAVAVIAVAAALSAGIFVGCADVKGVGEFAPKAASEEYRQQVMNSSVAYENLEWLGSGDMISRYGSVKEDEFSINYGVGKAAMNIAAKMEGMGYKPMDVSIKVNEEGYLANYGTRDISGLMTYSTAMQGQVGVNALYEKTATSGSRGQIIIMSHFDNLYDTVTSGATSVTAEGAYENGAAVATMLYAAQLLAQAETEYDIIFAFFGSSVISANNTLYYSWDGADAFLAKLPSLLGKEYNPVLAINLWRLGGENLYMYSADNQTSYNNYFYAVAEADGIDVSPVPEYKHAFSESFATNILATSPSGVFHAGLMNDSIYFINEGIPTLTYMSLDWDSGNEDSNPESPNVAFTGSDTLNNMILAFKGGEAGEQAIKTQLNGVALNIVNAVTGENSAMFQTAISTAREELKDDYGALYGLSIATTVLVWAAVIGLLIAAVILRGKNVTKMASRRPPQGPSVSNPFTEFDKGSPFEEFDDKNKNTPSGNSSGSSGSDIFEGF